MKVYTNTRIMKSNKINSSVIKKAISILIPTDQIDYKNVKTGFMPNLIHSLDASNIHLLIKNIKSIDLSGLNLYTIHDCFASDYKNMNVIELLVKHSFVELYFKENYLKIIDSSFINQISSNDNTYIYEDVNKNKIIVLPSGEEIDLPKLPDYN